MILFPLPTPALRACDPSLKVIIMMAGNFTPSAEWMSHITYHHFEERPDHVLRNESPH